jgi:hypothetical protein
MAVAVEARPLQAPPRDEAMAKVLAAIKRAPKGPPLTAEERARIVENRAGGYPAASANELQKALAALGSDDDT